MKIKNIIQILLIGIIITLFSCNEKKQNSDDKNKGIVAENLWGKEIPIDKIIQNEKPTIIVPFSSSHCGYCLEDGFYTEKNYIQNNTSFGGNSYHMSLFNPQLDVYTFQKHFHWNSDILTYPISLYKYHEDGFPTVLAFKKGKQIFKEFYDYSKLDTLSEKLWNGSKKLIPTSDLQMASVLVGENQINGAVFIYPQKTKIPKKDIELAKKWKNGECKNINQLSQNDLKKHLYLKGNFSFEEISNFFKNTNLPVKFINNTITIGNYKFDYSKTGIYFTCPNPFNKHKYIIIDIKNNNQLNELVNYLDFVLYQTDKQNTVKVLYGHFNKEDNFNWTFSEKNSFSDRNKTQFCKQQCEIPRKQILPKNNTNKIFYSVKKTDEIVQYTFGNDFCKFPDILADKQRNIWTVWEENGDINLAKIDINGKVKTIKIEQNTSDSYNAKLAFSNGKIWVFYLNNQSGYYWLYYKTYDDLRLSDEMLFNTKKPYDIIFPSIAYRNNEITVYYSKWISNYRLLAYAQLEESIKTKEKYIKVCPSKYTNNYINAWFSSISYDDSNNVWGAWNQHYPSTFGICGSKLNEKAQPITQSAEKMGDWEKGGYPNIFTNKNNKYIVWQSSDIWGLYNQTKTQNIKFSKYNNQLKKWSLGEIISVPNQIYINETPTGVVDKNDIIRVVYSGRTKEKNSKWGIYLTSFENNKWTRPKLISENNVNARSPKIIVNNDNSLWVTWHNGTGKNMNIKVMKIIH